MNNRGSTRVERDEALFETRAYLHGLTCQDGCVTSYDRRAELSPALSWTHGGPLWLCSLETYESRAYLLVGLVRDESWSRACLQKRSFRERRGHPHSLEEYPIADCTTDCSHAEDRGSDDTASQPGTGRRTLQEPICEQICVPA